MTIRAHTRDRNPALARLSLDDHGAALAERRPTPDRHGASCTEGHEGESERLEGVLGLSVRREEAGLVGRLAKKVVLQPEPDDRADSSLPHPVERFGNPARVQR